MPKCLRLLPLAALLLSLLLPAAHAGGKNRHYRDARGRAWYDVWWREQHSDPKTALMLHIGQPQDPAWMEPGNAKLAAQNDDDPLLDEDLGGALGAPSPGGGLGGLGTDMTAKYKKPKYGRDREQKAPAGKVFDYSPNRYTLTLPKGIRKVDEGRFGKALAFSGNKGLRLVLGDKGEHHVIDGWIKLPALPEAPMWILGSERGAQLRVLPEGKLELRWSTHKGEARSIVSEEGIDAGEWHHIIAMTWWSNDRFPDTERQLRINNKIVAHYQYPGRTEDVAGLFEPGEVLAIGADPDGKQGFRGMLDDIRITDRRHYCDRERWPDFPAGIPRPISFGAPLFEEDRRVWHIDFESPAVDLHPKKDARIQWKLGKWAEFADYQVDAPFGKGLLVDPAMGFPRIPIDGMSEQAGTLEMWFQPVNWDNNTMIGENMPRSYSMMRFKGRHKKTGEIVTFMSLDMPEVSMFGGKGWCQPGTWTHFVWSWSPDDVLKKDGWGDAKKGDPVGAFRAIYFGDLIWRAMVRRNTKVIGQVEPLYVEIGIEADWKGQHGQRPAIMVDELIFHSEPLSQEFRKKATQAWAKAYHPDNK